MKFVLASYGSRGDAEPCVALGCELLRRGHDVHVAVAPDMVGFVESAGLAAVGYGPDARKWLDAFRAFLTQLTRAPWRVKDLSKLWRENRALLSQYLDDTNTTLIRLAEDADLLLTGVLGEDAAANVAEYYNVPLATLHFLPFRAHGQLSPLLPGTLQRKAMILSQWLQWRMLLKKAEDRQRGELGLPRAKSPSPRRITERGSLEIQAYDEMWFPEVAAEWAHIGYNRPFVGALTVELPTHADDEVASWIAEGTPPIFFGFGSQPVESGAATIAMIGAACEELGERALVCSGWSDLSNIPHFDHVKVVDAVSYAAIFPSCRAVVHHGGIGSTAAGLRAGVPTLILSMMQDQAALGAVVKRLGVGTTRRFSSSNRESLVADLRTILTPQYAAQAREVATRMTKPAESVACAASLLEDFARFKSVG
ncbi:glycosyltransferase [Mycobacterium sp. 1274761.0]|uniref:glycosyltransferase n=1 Tax=Mycobacterium sp. 1274761.0 TaxID=1834077 RepID=UPI0008011286|nr:glycosyltransferase [Mycobacterium sp. 1274761.0]OBK79200.1 glycosyl transferase family 1 [Mycobacterium sp. 1274761.0]